MTLKNHPSADWLPVLSDSEYRELRDDIQNRGLREPILVKSGHIIDGRHRLRACKELGIEPRFEEYEGDDILAEIASRNLFRRNLTPQERAALVVKMCGDQLAKEAHDRKTASLKKGEQFPVAPKLAPREARGRTAERIAKMAKVGRNVAREALRVHKDRAAPKKKKPRKPREISFEEEVMRGFQKFMDFWCVTKRRQAKEILLRFLST